MTMPIVLLLVSLFVIVVIQTINRLAGAVCLFLWCAAATAYGLYAFDIGVELKMFGIEAKRWNFLAFMAVMMGYNLVVIYRVLARRRKPDAESEDISAVLDEERERQR